MKKVVIIFYIIYLFSILFITLNPYYIQNHKGADIVIVIHMLSFVLLFISMTIGIFDKVRREEWLLSVKLSLVMMFFVTPLLMILYFIVIPAIMIGLS